MSRVSQVVGEGGGGPLLGTAAQICFFYEPSLTPLSFLYLRETHGESFERPAKIYI